MMFGGGWCGGLGVGGWLLMGGFWLAFLALVVWAVTRLFPSARSGADTGQVLDRRLATGEIDPDTYRQVTTELPSGHRQAAARR